jgi:hypothetical protein
MLRGARKQRRTYSLDPELVGYVEETRKQRRATSASSALEQILRESKARQELAQQDALIAKYYSSLNESEEAAEREWGTFTETQFPTE